MTEPIEMKAGDKRVLVNVRPLPLDFRIVWEENYKQLKRAFDLGAESGSLPSDEEIRSGADEWVFDINGMKWSNNDDTAADNFGSFMAGAKWMRDQALHTHDVVGQIEQLKAFAQFLYTKEYLVKRSIDEAIDEFERSL